MINDLILRAPARISRAAIAAALLFVLSLLGASSAHAISCTKTYVGPANASWNVNGNWSGGTQPSAADIVCIPSGQGTIEIGGTANAMLLAADSPIKIDSGATLAIADNTFAHISTFTGIDLIGTISGGNSQVELDSGTLSGTGTITHPFAGKGGLVAPGGVGTVGALHFDSQFSLSQDGAGLALDIASDSSFDKIVPSAAQDSFFETPITVTFLGSYAPAIGTEWDFTTGALGTDSTLLTITPSVIHKVSLPGGLGLLLADKLPVTTPPVTTTPTTPTTPVTPVIPVAPIVPPAPVPPAPDVHRVLLGCGARKLVLNDVLISGGHVVLDGAADASLAGQTVKILFNGKQQVASAKVAASGAFHTTAPLPAAKLRTLDSTRYTAVAGAQRSLDLKLVRRLVLQAPHFAGGKVTLSGQVLAPLAAPAASVSITQQIACGATTVVRTFKPGADGRFKVSLPAPSGAGAAIYRLQTKVRKTVHTKSLSSTFSLPLPALLA